MRYSREYLESLSAQTGYRPDTLEKVLRLERLLDLVNRHPFLGSRLALKGGTALNLFFYGQAPRLSVDLDFNYIGARGREEMLRERPQVERAVAEIAKGEEYRIQQGPEEHAGRKYYLSFRNGQETQDRIEIDLFIFSGYHLYRFNFEMRGRPTRIRRAGPVWPDLKK